MNDHKERAELRAHIFSKGKPVPFEVGNKYTTIGGKKVRFVKIHNEGTYYETMEDEEGVNRYSNTDRLDMGRVTGTSAFDTKENNVLPMYHFSEEALKEKLALTTVDMLKHHSMSDEKPSFYCDNEIFYFDVEKEDNGEFSLFFKNRRTNKVSYIDQSEDNCFAWYFGALHGFTTRKDERDAFLAKGMSCIELTATGEIYASKKK